MVNAAASLGLALPTLQVYPAPSTAPGLSAYHTLPKSPLVLLLLKGIPFSQVMMPEAHEKFALKYQCLRGSSHSPSTRKMLHDGDCPPCLARFLALRRLRMMDLKLGPGLARGVATESPCWSQSTQCLASGWVSRVVPGHLPQLAVGSHRRCVSSRGAKLVQY